jgi:hypothetical protein
VTISLLLSVIVLPAALGWLGPRLRQRETQAREARAAVAGAAAER